MARKSSITTDIARNFIEVESNSGCILVSEKCENSRVKIQIKCNCGNLCSTRASSYENKERHFCDAKCYGKWYGENLVGENSYTWNPNLTQEEREAGRDYNEYYNFTKEVYERDYYTCQCCGVKGGNINAHHIYSYNKYKTVRTDISNGITFCTTCHKEFHKKHGNGNNDWYQLREFIYDKWVDSNDLNLVALLEEIDLRMNNIKELVESA